MTDEQMKKLTLGDLDRIAARFADAVKKIREGQALLAGNTPRAETPEEPSEPEAEDAAAAHRRRQFQAPEPPPGRTHSVLGPAEIAERNRLMGRQRVDPNLPDDIKEAMEAT